MEEGERGEPDGEDCGRTAEDGKRGLAVMKRSFVGIPSSADAGLPQ